MNYANLSHANMAEAVISTKNQHSSGIGGIRRRRTDLSGVSAQGADLTDAQLEKQSSRWPISRTP